MISFVALHTFILSEFSDKPISASAELFRQEMSSRYEGEEALSEKIIPLQLKYGFLEIFIKKKKSGRKLCKIYCEEEF